MGRKELMALFNKQPRVGVPATSNKLGGLNAAVFGLPKKKRAEMPGMGISAGEWGSGE